MTNKLKYFIGNWKMFGDFGAFKIINKINLFSKQSNISLKKKKIVICLPNTLIQPFSKKLKTKYISLGAQNCHSEENFGPFTGSVSSSMLKKAGANYIIIGHSENRFEGDTNELIKKKIISANNQKLNIIFCIGETSKERRKKKTFSILKKQLQSSLAKEIDLNKIIIAYEPVWSIGTNKTPKRLELLKVVSFIKKETKKIFKTSKSLRVIYGGSVNSKNIVDFASMSNVDGFLIGRASQSSKKFIDIVKNYYK